MAEGSGEFYFKNKLIPLLEQKTEEEEAEELTEEDIKE